MKNLLYLQADITHAEEKLAELACRDSRCSDGENQMKDWWTLSQGNEKNGTEQWEKVLEIRKKLDKYNEIIIKQTYLARLEQPRPYDIEFLRSWFRRPGMGSFPLLGIDGNSWDVEYEDDLVAIKARTAPDMFSKWFTETLVPIYHHLLGERFKKPINDEAGEGIYHYNESVLKATLSTLTTVVASVLPICSVLVQYFVESNSLRLGLIIIFSALFSLALAVMTSARKVEIFAATSAFAAVNVVFLTNNDSCCSAAAPTDEDVSAAAADEYSPFVEDSDAESDASDANSDTGTPSKRVRGKTAVMVEENKKKMAEIVGYGNVDLVVLDESPNTVIKTPIDEKYSNCLVIERLSYDRFTQNGGHDGILTYYGVVENGICLQYTISQDLKLFNEGKPLKIASKGVTDLKAPALLGDLKAQCDAIIFEGLMPRSRVAVIALVTSRPSHLSKCLLPNPQEQGERRRPPKPAASKATASIPKATKPAATKKRPLPSESPSHPAKRLKSTPLNTPPTTKLHIYVCGDGES
ncbi:hypothetical protein V491_07756, partial [Pseudogymnoascus sp. VKM F-3775]